MSWGLETCQIKKCVCVHMYVYVCVCFRKTRKKEKKEQNPHQRPHEVASQSQIPGLELMNGSYSQSTLRLIHF